MKIFLFILFCFISISLIAEETTRVKRYAILVGANDGGDERAILRYAETDAKMVADVLFDIGGIDPSSSILLLNPDMEALKRSFKKIESIMSQDSDDVRSELIFYYSGHSDEEGLLMREDHYYYQDLKSALTATNADVKIGILDSCSSGAFTQLKGGKHNAPFLIDDSVKTSGHAFITSAAEDEAAQESNRLQASFFTHFLVSALRGAADTSADGKVTLHEAYSYAQSETLARTERTQAGAQHASYDFRLSGSGDVVLTDLRDADSTLILTANDYGRFFIRDSKDNLITEVNKKSGNPVNISVPSSNYTVIKEVDGMYWKQKVNLAYGAKREARISNYSSFVPESNVIRGKSNDYIEYELNVPETTAVFNWSKRDKLRIVKFDFLPISKGRTLEGTQISLANLIADDVYGAQLSIFLNVGGGDFTGIQSSSFFNVIGGNVENYGFQFSSFFNWVSHGSDSLVVQGGGLFNWIGQDTEGFTFQGSSLFNTIGGNAHSFTSQIAGLYNTAGNLPGLQISSLFNKASDVKGLQLTGAINIGNEIKGAQISSIANKADDVYGGQISLVNIADYVYGFQIGLININQDIKGIPIGLINVSLNGMKHLSYHFNTTTDQHYLNYQFGSSYLYHLLYIGLPENPDLFEKFSLGAGGGFHIPLSKIYGELEASVRSNLTNLPGEELKYHSSDVIIGAKVGVPLWDDISIYGGINIEFPEMMDENYVDEFGLSRNTFIIGVRI